MLNTISKKIRLTALNTYRDFCRSYVRDTYGVTGDVCFIYSDDGRRLFYMTDTTQGTCLPSDKSCQYIRRLTGENKIVEYGLLDGEDIPQLVLIPTLSMLKVLGPKGFYQFLKNWTGESKVEDLTVIKYSVMK